MFNTDINNVDTLPFSIIFYAGILTITANLGFTMISNDYNLYMTIDNNLVANIVCYVFPSIFMLLFVYK